MTPDNASQRILHPFLNGPFSSRRNTVRYNTREKYQETPHLVPITTLIPRRPLLPASSLRPVDSQRNFQWLPARFLLSTVPSITLYCD